MFRPKRIVPNTLDPKLGGLDWAALPGVFSGCLSTDGHAFRAEVRQAMAAEIGFGWSNISLDPDEGEDVALANLAGEGALEIAQKWCGREK